MASQDIRYSSWYASQIWATPYLQQGKEMDSPLQKWLLVVLNRMLGVRDTTPSWCVMWECGLEPLQFQWVLRGNAAVQAILWLNQLHKGWSDTIVHLQTEAATLWNHWSQPFCGRPQGETLGVLDTLFWNSSERTQQQTLYLSSMVCSSYQKGSGHSFAFHPSQIHVSLPASGCHP